MGYVAFIVILCAMVVIHEFGHFIVAKMLGIQVEVFSVGFGPRLLGFQLGQTDYRLSAVPLGGYVRFRGENMEMLQGKSEGSVDEFLAHPGWKRFLVALAGPAFNIATAILIPAAAIMIGFEDDIYNAQQVVIGDVRPSSTAEAAGLQKGDRVVQYRDVKNPTWQDFQDGVLVRYDEDIPLIIERNGQRINLSVKPRVEKIGNDMVGRIDLEPPITYVRAWQIVADSPAERAGLKAGDRIVAVNGTPIFASSQVTRTAQDGQPMALTVERGQEGQQERLEIRATPEKKGEQPYLLGVSLRPGFQGVLVKTSSVTEALRYGWEFNKRILKLTGVIFQQMFSGKRSVRDVLGGPVKIAQETSNTYEIAGWAGTIQLMGMLSLNLGIFNLLPIPVLDGGMILLIIIEGLLGLLGLSLTMTMRERFQQVGFVIVILLMGFVMINDILPR